MEEQRMFLSEENMGTFMEVASGKYKEVVQYVKNNLITDTVYFSGTLQKISEQTRVSVRTVTDCLKKMMSKNVLKKVSNGIYKLNPIYLSAVDEKEYLKKVETFQKQWAEDKIVDITP